MDTFLIDSHKAIYHPERVAVINNYVANPQEPEAREAYKSMMPLYMEVSPVGACNHRCTFCSVDYIGYKSIFLDPKIYKASIEQNNVQFPIKSIMFAGEGEPLLHKGISEFLSINNANSIESSFTTNGVLLTRDRFESILPLTKWIKVSLNAGTRESYAKIHQTNPNDFDKVWQNLADAAKYIKQNKFDCILGIQVLLLPENSHEIETLVKKAKESGLRYVVVKPYSQHLLSTDRDYKNIDYSDFYELGNDLTKYNSQDFEVIFRLNTMKAWDSGNDNRYCKCYSTPSLWGYIMANGDVYSCSAYLLDERFKLGNIYENTFSKIWCSNKKIEHSEFVINSLDINECRVNCRMNAVNVYLDKLINNKVPHRNFI